MKIVHNVTPVTIVLAICAALLSVTSTAASASAAEEMTQQQAGREYLAVICRTNAAEDVFGGKVWKGRDRISEPEVRRRLPELRRLSAKVSIADSNAARDLFNPPAEWPTIVASQVRIMANGYLRTGNLRSGQGSAYSAGQWLRLNGRANDVGDTMVSASRKIRAKLNLPPPGKGC